MTRINSDKKNISHYRLPARLLAFFLLIMVLLLTVNGVFLYQTGRVTVELHFLEPGGER